MKIGATDKGGVKRLALTDLDRQGRDLVLEWAKAEGHEKDISQELLDIVGAQSLSDAEIENKIAEMKAARQARNFRLSDAIRDELTSAGVLVEITKDGIRWRRK